MTDEFGPFQKWYVQSGGKKLLVLKKNNVEAIVAFVVHYIEKHGRSNVGFEQTIICSQVGYDKEGKGHEEDLVASTEKSLEISGYGNL